MSCLKRVSILWDFVPREKLPPERGKKRREKRGSHLQRKRVQCLPPERKRGAGNGKSSLWNARIWWYKRQKLFCPRVNAKEWLVQRQGSCLYIPMRFYTQSSVVFVFIIIIMSLCPESVQRECRECPEEEESLPRATCTQKRKRERRQREKDKSAGSISEYPARWGKSVYASFAERSREKSLRERFYERVLRIIIIIMSILLLLLSIIISAKEAKEVLPTWGYLVKEVLKEKESVSP